MVLSKCENYNVIAEIGIDLLLLLLCLSRERESTPPKDPRPNLQTADVVEGK